jgi:hypothetical protein
VKKVFNQLMKGKTKFVEHYENPIINKKGEEKIISWHNSLIRDNGNIFGILSSGTDITEKKRAEEEKGLQSEMMKNISEGIYLIGTDDFIIKYVNPKFEKMRLYFFT